MDKSTDQRPDHSSASTAARAVGLSNADRGLELGKCHAGRGHVGNLDECLLVDRANSTTRAQEADVPQPDRVRTRPHLVTPALAHAQPPAPVEDLGHLRLGDQLRRLHIHHHQTGGGLQQEVGHVPTQGAAVAARHPERLAGDPPD